jgi:fatty acid desaturase
MSCNWTLYGQEFDLTDFLRRHPGGELALRLGQGRDCTRLYEQYHVLNDNHIKMLRGFGLNGDGVPAPDAFFVELKEAVRRLDDIKTTPLMLLALECLFFLNCWAWYGWFSGTWFAAFSLPFVSWLFIVNIAHDAAHFAFSQNAAINELCAWFSSPLFYNTPYWYLQHNVSHHANTNDVHEDIDLHHVEQLVRSHRSHLWLPAHRFQIFSLSLLNLSLTTFSENVLFPMQLLLGEHRFFGNVAAAFDYNRITLFVQMGLSLACLVVPFLSFGILKALFFATWPFVAGSLIFVTVTQISHIQEETQRHTSGWAHWSHQMVDTSYDYAQESALVTFLTGGLNMQGLHHCLPGLSSSRFQQVYPVYRALCAKHNLKIHEAGTFFEAVRRYWIYIYKLSKERFRD